MLRVFAPQLPLYGIGIVLTGVLQAHRRFAWPVLAPLLSSVTVIGAYLLFAARRRAPAPTSPAVGVGGELILSVGTTLGVVVLSLCLLIPLRRLRPAAAADLRGSPAGAGRRGASAGRAGAVTVGSQQVAVAGRSCAWPTAARTGAAVVFTVAQTVFLLPVGGAGGAGRHRGLPGPGRRAAAGDQDGYRATPGPGRPRRAAAQLPRRRRAGRRCAEPVARVLLGASPGAAPRRSPASRPGLLGYGLFALLSPRPLRRGAPRPPRRPPRSAGWWSPVAALVLSAGLRRRPTGCSRWRLANSVGMLVLGGAAGRWPCAAGPARPRWPGCARAAGVGLVAAASRPRPAGLRRRPAR